MILLTLFFTVINSWRIIFSFSPEQRDKITVIDSQRATKEDLKA